MPAAALTRLLFWALAVAFAGTGAVCVVVATGGPDDVPPTGSPVPTSPASATPPAHDREPTSSRARDVLRTWDDARAGAWTSGDLDALRALYTPASAAGHRDVAMLRAWNARGARVTALTTQVLSLDVVAESQRRLVLVVTDRVAHAAAGAVDLPDDGPSTRRLVLERGSGTWRMASVSPEPRARS